MKKETNPKDSVGSGKVGLSNVSAPVLMMVALAMEEGARKYGRHNYRVAGVKHSIYYDAVMRHMMAWWEGEDIDPDSGLPHVAKAMASLAVLLDSILYGNDNDDRPPKYEKGWINELNEKTKDLTKLYPNPILPYREKNDEPNAKENS